MDREEMIGNLMEGPNRTARYRYVSFDEVAIIRAGEIMNNMTMIYTEMEQTALADQAVAKAEKESVDKGTEIPQEEKDRLWHLVKSMVESG